MVDVVVMGNKSIKAIKITPDALSPDNAEMIEEALKMALEEAFAQIDKADAEIEEKVTGRPGGLGF
jgi:Uncharacterized protein conserved in bacteria